MDKAHGRVETRTLSLSASVPLSLSFPFVAQIFKIERTRLKVKTGEQTTEVVYGITSLNKSQASPKRLLALNRGHWGIENGLHHVRDVTFDEDRSQIRTQNGPRMMVILRNAAIAIARRLGFRLISKALRTLAYGAKAKVMRLLGIV